MSKRDDIRRIFRESFNFGEDYVKMIFESVYKDAEGMLLTDMEGNPASSLFLRQYEMTFHGDVQQVGYIFAPATRRQQRGKGYMTQLVHDAIRQSAERGDMMCAIIPESEAMAIFYRRAGFSTLFYMKEQRFTALHSFPGEGSYELMEEMDVDRVWEAFNRFQHERKCYILHSRQDFVNVLDAVRYSGGDFVVMLRNDEDLGPVVASMVWAMETDGLLLVTDLMGESVDARLAAMRQLRGMHSSLPFLFYGRPTDKMGGRLMPRGMGRIVNVRKCLESIAKEDSKRNLKVKVSDDFLPELNSHIYLINDGRVTIDDSYSGRPDFDVTVDVLGRLAFNSEESSEITGFPSVRPMISLMLD